MARSSQTGAGALEDKLAALMAQATENERILHRAQARELMVLQAGSLPALLETLVGGLATSYGLDLVTVTLCDPEHELRHLLLNAGVERVPAGVAFVDSMVGITPVFSGTPRPWVGPYAAADHQLLFAGHRAPASVALLPLKRQGALIGSVNFGSADAQRFTRELATDFMQHLAVIAAFALENEVNRARLIRSGFTDVLTGCHNRRYLQTRLLEELARARRKRQPLGCLVLDLDWFKRVNDTHGHQAGDVVLRESARRIEAEARASDIVARFGGEEFVLLLPDTDSASGAATAERIRRVVRGAPVSLDGGEAVTVTVSIGVASTLPPRATVGQPAELKTIGEALLASADHALYRAKAAGRDRVLVADAG
ncbi:MAG: DUF484 family protein [Pseudomonadota bacterium]